MNYLPKLFGGLCLVVLAALLPYSCNPIDNSVAEPAATSSKTSDGAVSTATQVKIGEVQNGAYVLTADEVAILDAVTEYFETVEGAPVGSLIFTDVAIAERTAGNNTLYSMLINGTHADQSGDVQVALTLDRDINDFNLTSAAGQTSCETLTCSQCQIKYDNDGAFCECLEYPDEGNTCSHSTSDSIEGETLILVQQLLSALT